MRRFDPDEAWETLRRASQEFNVKVRELAVAVVELLARAPAPQPDGDRTIHPSGSARRAAEQLLLAFESRPDDEAGLRRL
ncbi:ANTAR domain-containing protein [Amycolatopsis sp. OK19-0408]|uniref:ANTAR domain-containing protein n=1 Tax=Amycolatopsis iheyensis TaxID=2945988 RepID=A0A9X2SMS0_9PSEU|nr:ANTAR domain-containing protein [Amycolatopsis iheyensis]